MIFIKRRTLQFAILIIISTISFAIFASDEPTKTMKELQYETLLRQQSKLRKSIGTRYEKAQRAIMKYDAFTSIDKSIFEKWKKDRLWNQQAKRAVDATPKEDILTHLTATTNNGQQQIIHARVNKINVPISMKIDKTTTGPNDLSALGYAIKQRDTEIVKSLLKSGVNLHKPINRLLLVEAANTEQEDIAGMLIDANANLDLKDPTSGQTALMYALEWGSNDSRPLAEKLLEAGADVTIVDNKGKTALDYAKENDLSDLVKLIKFKLSSPATTTQPPTKEEPFFKIF